jgi:hypothetical protein
MYQLISILHGARMGIKLGDNFSSAIYQSKGGGWVTLVGSDEAWVKIRSVAPAISMHFPRRRGEVWRMA